MGVEYSGNYGIGVRVKDKEFEQESEWFEDFWGYLDDVLEDTSYSYFEVGEGSYTGESNDIYVCIDNPFDNGYDIRDKVSAFKSFLAEKGIEYYGDVDEIGGLNVY